MTKITAELDFFIHLAKVESQVSRAFTEKLNGVSYTEFILLYHLSQAPQEKMRRTDLAEVVGLTASGITRLLLPMEKIGLVGRQDDERDARVKYVTLSPGGREKLANELPYANAFAESKCAPGSREDITKLAQILEKILR